MKYILMLFLSSICAAQVVTVGPFTGPAIDPSQCTVTPNQTSVCFAKDGVHVSIVGSPYGGALCDSSNPACLGPQGVSGQNGLNGSNGQAATVTIGSVTSGAVPAVTNSGTSNAAVFNFVLQQGPIGATGPPGILQVPSTLSGTLTCQPQVGGSIPKGFTTTCTFNVTSVQ